MTIFYSTSTGGFYDDAIHDSSYIPVDAIQIEDSVRQTLLAGLAAGGRIILDSNGQLTLIPRSQEETNLVNAENVRAQRNELLSRCDWTQLPDVPSAIQAKWTAYRQSLRDITSQPGFPNTITWPDAPV